MEFPKYLSIQTTSLCNGHCIFCPYDEIKDLFPKMIMEESLFRKIIDECSQYKNIERIILYLNNEPLTDPYLIERINYTKEKIPWASVHILTNGSLLTDELADRLIDSKLDWIGFSLHGIRKETIEKTMGLNYDLTFRRVLNFIEKAKEKKDIKEYIMVTFLRHKYLSLEEKEEAIKFWQDKGIERISYFEGPVSRAGNVKDLPKVRHEKIYGCTSIWANEMIHIVENGDVIMCCMDWKREVILGNVKKQSIYEIWNSEKYNRIRNKRDGNIDSEDDFICKRCESAIPSQSTSFLPISLEINRKSDILLILCPMWGTDAPSLGISYLYSYLRFKGYSPSVKDLNIEMFHNATEEEKKLWRMENYRLWNDRKLFEKNILSLFNDKIDFYVNEILAEDTKIIGFSVNAGNLLFSIEVAKRIKGRDRNKIIIFGGPHSKWFKMDIDYLEKYKDVYRGFYPGLVDIFVIGEGELILEEILYHLKDDKKIEDTKGIILYKENKYLCLGEEVFIENLNELPYPDFDWSDLSRYTEKKIPILMSRGCIRRCKFCNDTFVSPKYRCRMADNVFREMVLRIEKNKINKFEFFDLIINGNLHELEKLCELVIKNKLHISWTGQAAIRKEMNRDFLLKMKKAGCEAITYGIESFSDKVLELMNKPYTYDDIEKVLRDTARVGIKANINIIVGFPGEGEEEFNETYEGIKRLRKYIYGISSLTPCLITLGSSLQFNLDRYGIIYPGIDGYFTWYSKDGNTYGLRKERTKKILSLASELNLPIGIINLYDEGDRIKPKVLADKLDILLAICPPWGVETPPLGLACLSAYLRSKGLNTEIFDFNIYLYNKVEPKYKYLWEMGSANYWRKEESFNLLYSLFKKEIDFCVEKIISSGAKVVGFSVLSNSQDRITALVIKQVKEKKPEIKIILGGTSISVPEQRWFFEKNIPELIEAYVLGEGEETLYEILYSIKCGGKIEAIPGVLTFKDGKYSYTPRIPKENLDEFPFPTFEEFDLSAYLNKSKGLIMEWARGCIGNCAFCAFKTISPKFRKKTPEAIIKAIDYYVKRYGAEHFSLVDSAINGDLEYLERICDLLIKADLNVKFSCLAIPRHMDYSLLEKMKKAGFIRIEYGVESGSDKVLKAMRKIYTSQDAENTLRATHKAGIKTVIYLIVGFPGEGEAEFEETIEFLERNAQYIDLVKSVNPLYLMAGSSIYKNYKDYGITLPEVDPDFKWFIGKENTYELRLERVRRIRSILDKFGIKYFPEDDMFERKMDLERLEVKEKEDKKMDILLVTLPPWGVENPPLGLGYLEACLKEKGITCQVLDLNVYFYNTIDSAYKMLWHVENKNFWSNEKTFPLICEIFKSQIDYAVNKILSIDTDLIGFSVVDPKERITIEVIKRVKEKSPEKKIILGGPTCSTDEQRDFFTENIPALIDYFVVGEGEDTLYEIIQKERSVFSKEDILGVAKKLNNKWYFLPRPPINLDEIPFPKYEGFNLAQYNGGKSILVEWSRGCMGRCSFCKNYRLEGLFRRKSPEKVIKELEFLSTQYKIEEFTVRDNIMNGDIRQLNEICEGIIKKKFRLKWSGQIAPRKEMDYDLFLKMRKAGCSKIQIGVESGSDKVLVRMKKFYNSKIAEDNIRKAKKAGLEVEVFIMVGFPGETEKEFKKTYDFIKRNAKYIDTLKSINTLHLIAGTDVYENYQKYNLKPLPKKNWHYLWETYDGNTYEIRKKRVEKLLDLAYDLGLKVMETNIQEGKEEFMGDDLNLQERLERLKSVINRLQVLPIGKRKEKRHSLFKLILLGFLSLFTLFYMTYFWLFKKLRGKFLLGGE